MKVDEPGIAQLFYDRGAGINEADSFVVRVGPSDRPSEFEFHLPNRGVRELRFDPFARSGRFTISKVQVNMASGAPLLEIPLFRIVPKNDIATWEIQNGSLVGATKAGAGDPQLVFPLPKEGLTSVTRFPWATLLAAVLVGAVAGRQIARQVVWAFQAARSLGESSLSPLLVLVTLVCVVALTLSRLFPLHTVFDYPLWDELNYAERGRDWMRNLGPLGDLHSSPLYVLLYGFLSYFGDLWHTIYLQHYLVKVFTVGLLFIVLWRMWSTIPGAAAAALYVGLTQFHIEFPIIVYQCGLAILLGAVALMEISPLCGLSRSHWRVVYGKNTC